MEMLSLTIPATSYGPHAVPDDLVGRDVLVNVEASDSGRAVLLQAKWSAARRVEVRFDGHRILQFDSPLSHVVVSGAPVGGKAPRLHASATELSLTGTLTFEGHVTDSLDLRSAELTLDQGFQVKELLVSGRCRVQGNLSSVKTTLDSDTSLTSGGGLKLGEVLLPGGSVEIEGSLTVQTMWPQHTSSGARTTLFLHRAGLTFDAGRRAPACLTSVTIAKGEGSNIIVADGRWIEAVEFAKYQGVLTLERGASATDISGEIRGEVHARKGAKLTGSTDNPVSIVDLGDVAGAEIAGVRVNKLGISALNHLGSLARFEPALGENFRSAWKASRGIDHQSRPADAAEIAFRWRQIAIALNGRSSSRTQSLARQLDHHWRRKSTKLGWRAASEWGLRHLFWMFGYGERVVQPLLAFTVVCFLVAGVAAAAPWQGFGTWGSQTWASTVDNLFEPMKVIRLVPDDPAASTTSGAIMAQMFLVRLVGVVALGFCALAVRRTTRAE
jgi:hypothetical protein